MAQMDDVMAELRHRIMRPFESGPPKPAQPQHQETNEEGATPQSFNAECQRHGSAAVALRRLAHPGRDGGVVAEDDPVSEPINPERGGGAVVKDELSELFKRLSRDMPELMEEVVAFIERRTAEMNGDDGAPRPTERRASRFRAGYSHVAGRRRGQDCDHVALRHPGPRPHRCRCQTGMGFSRAAWLHVAADERLEGRR
jgi:hypothetical protein